MESINKAIIDPNYEPPNISRHDLSLKNIIGEGMTVLFIILKVEPTETTYFMIIHCVGEFGVVYRAEVMMGEKQSVAAKTIKGT